jgi:hypothetical protein
MRRIHVPDESYDVVVIGAGLAGLCCAGELVVQGLRPLLISETKEVGAALGNPILGGHLGVKQAPTWQVGWDGGWWPMLARRLNVPIKVPMGFNTLGYDLYIKGDPALHSIPQSVVSAAGLTDAFCQIFPHLKGVSNELGRVLGAGLAIPWRELVDMDTVPLLAWLQDQTSDEMVVNTIMALANSCVTSTGSFCREHLSVFGGIGGLRSVFAGEAVYGYVYPDNRRGLAIPFAEAIERNGGTVRRGAKVASVNVGDGRISSVVLTDGTEIRTSAVALACSNARLVDILDPIPQEAQSALEYGMRTLHRDYHAYALLDKEILDPDSYAWRGIVGQDGSLISWSFTISHVPWHMSESAAGKQLVVAARCLPESEAAQHGSDEEIFAALHDDMEFYNPGYRAATLEIDNRSQGRGHLWFENLFVGPKLPRTVDSVEGLYFVNQSSKPNMGFYMEAGASAGILGARQIAADRKVR